MSDVKISELPPITNAELASDDVMPIVDVNVDTTKKIAIGELDLRYSISSVTRGNITGVNIGVSGGSQAAWGNGVTITLPQPVDIGATVQFLKAILGMLDVDNIRLDGNDIATIGINSDLNLNPNGTGKINFLKEAIFQSILRVDSDFILGIVTENATGSNQILALPAKSIVSLINSGLASVRGITASGNGKIIVLTNRTGNPVTIQNELGTATQQIVTGTGADLTLENNASLLLYYNSKYYVIGGSGSGGGGGAVDSVNGQTGDVVLELNDIDDVDAPTPTPGDVLTFDGTDWVPQAPEIPAVDSVNGQTGDVELALDDLSDVNIPTPTDGDVLTYDSGEWVPSAPPSAPVESVNGQTGEVELALDDLEDVNASSPSDGNTLIFDADTGEWVPSDISGAFVPQSSTPNQVYGTDGSGDQTTYPISDGDINSSVAKRTVDGSLLGVTLPDSDGDAQDSDLINRKYAARFADLISKLNLKVSDYSLSPNLLNNGPVTFYAFDSEDEYVWAFIEVPKKYVPGQNIVIESGKVFANSTDTSKNIRLTYGISLFKSGDDMTSLSGASGTASVTSTAAPVISTANGLINLGSATIAPSGVIDSESVAGGDVLVISVKKDIVGSNAFVDIVNLLEESLYINFTGV